MPRDTGAQLAHVGEHVKVEVLVLKDRPGRFCPGVVARSRPAHGSERSSGARNAP